MRNVREVLGPGGALSRALASYERRPEQLRMAEAVETALADGAHLLVEAGTGTGKSLAYLVPAVQSGLRVVISTATKTLGEQIVQRDLPTLARLGLVPDVALVKGLANYVCLRRFEDYRRSASSGAIRTDVYFDSVAQWLEETETGDRGDVGSVPDDAAVWREITSSSETRIGAKCRHFDQCFVTKIKRHAERAQIIVTNHHLFCADMALRSIGHGAQALPDYDAVIFDEAHAVEDVATEFLGVRLVRARLEALFRDAARALELSGLFTDASRRTHVSLVMATAASGSVKLFSNLPRAPRDTPGRILLAADMFEGALGEGVRALGDGLSALAAVIADFVGESEALLSLSRRIRSAREALERIANHDDGAYVAYAESDARGGGALGASPVDVGPFLRDQLFSHAGAVVLTSATLATAHEGGFGFVRERLGVPEGAHELALASPFDYGTQAALYVARHIPEPRDEGYFDAAVVEIRRLVEITHGGAFVLCTSLRNMRAFATELRATWRYPTLVQGEAPKAALLDQFRAEQNAVLFAAASFWQGVDVPGRALRLVIIDKLPFDAPNDPVVSARIQRLQLQGAEPFMQYQVPAAALALKQGFGRLIRTRHDAGIVAILDRRLVTRGYGKHLLAALPPASRCYSSEELRAFWSSITEGDVTDAVHVEPVADVGS